MVFIQFNDLANYISVLICSIRIITLSVILIIIFHILLFLFRDRKYIEAFKLYKDPESVAIEDLKEIPLVNIIIPAWNEGEVFRQCLEAITKLNYPKLNVIINAGGSEETIEIANLFRSLNYFKILSQKPGGKIKAINECLSYVNEGILYLVDADVYITDEILLRMLFPLINCNEYAVIGGVRPLKFQEKKDLVKYLRINRNINFRSKFSRYRKTHISGANTCVKYEVIKSIEKFTENKVYAVEAAQAEDIISKGFKIYRLVDYRARLYTKVPDTIKAWIRQKIRWHENFLAYSFQNKKRNLLKFLFLFLFSVYLIIFPFFIFIHFSLVLIGICMLLSIYLKKIRRIIFAKKNYKTYFEKVGFLFYFKLIIYIYIEALTYVYITFEWIIFGNKKLKKRKNL